MAPSSPCESAKSVYFNVPRGDGQVCRPHSTMCALYRSILAPQENAVQQDLLDSACVRASDVRARVTGPALSASMRAVILSPSPKTDRWRPRLDVSPDKRVRRDYKALICLPLSRAVSINTQAGVSHVEQLPQCTCNVSGAFDPLFSALCERSCVVPGCESRMQTR